MNLENEQILLQMLFKRNAELIQLRSEKEMLQSTATNLAANLKELQDKIPDLDRDM